ncbi:DUF4326 domain-containing protein [Zophobihabitans entericus]|uniref:DUF4326 domain-containing protein n=1 Tax=Zophobihabitans entericus TaxID=1635327 RepID=A0A6G9I7Q7_9GAMM|nr:DUF4326 domain-containing protein [Zophobihabitans entericus]QIQ20241.1 DUF4326 domain-containing protein [Zophobihabitans entericus]
MNKILLLYPKSFKCYSKFFRKVEKIISKLDLVTILFLEDSNNFISRLSKESMHIKEIKKLSNWSINNITHAIIFDDGEEFPEEVKQIESLNIPLRYIKIAITRVVNIKNEIEYTSEKSTSTYEYIGRGSYWGNPYSIYEVEDLDKGETPRENVIRKFKYDFEHDCLLNRDKNKVYELAGKRLGCFCKPEACHGDVIADFLNSWDDEK